jgi:uncharacterized protein YdaU (DUF1376 family)
MHYYQFNPAAYCLDTSHLSNKEDLAYRRLLDLCYTTEKELPLEIPALARKVRCGSTEVGVVLAEFFIKSETGYTNERVQLELSKLKEFVEAGKAGAEKRWGKKKKCPPMTSDMGSDSPPIEGHTQNDSPLMLPNTYNLGPIPPIVPEGDLELNVEEPSTESDQTDPGFSADFLAFWESYPEKKEKRAAWRAWGRMKARPSVSVMVEAIRLQSVDRAKAKSVNEFYPEWKNPSTWLTGGCWEDTLKYAAKKEKAPDQAPANWREILLDLHSEAYPDGMESGNFPSAFRFLPQSVQQEVRDQVALVAEISTAIHRNAKEAA